MNIKIEGLDALIKDLKKRRDELPAKRKQFLWRLGNIGVNTANVNFKFAQYDGTNDVTVSTNWVDDHTLEVVAAGGSVTFIEFGSGVHYEEWHPQRPPGMEIGGYGRGQGNRDYWFYEGEAGTNGIPSTKKPGLMITHGNPPARAMYQASVDIREKIAEIAKEVYS